MRKILFIGLVITAVVLISGCYGPTTGPNATVQPTKTPGEITPVMTPVETETPFIISTPVETVTPIETIAPVGTMTPVRTITPVGITGVTGTPTVTGTATATMTVVATNTVGISGSAYNPAIITVPSGTTVTWTNSDSVPHTVTGVDFDSGSLQPGQTFSRTFGTIGSYDYGCTIHPTMSGTVVVT